MKFFSTASIIALVSLTSCGVDPNIEPMLTIHQGIYGQTTSASDFGFDTSAHYNEMEIRVLPAMSTFGAVPPIATTTSHDRGFYEIALEPGSYRLCTSFGRCVTATVQVNTLARWDYEFSEGPGWAFVPR